MKPIKTIANVIVKNDSKNNKYIYDDVEVEVLSIHLQTEKVRVRYMASIFGGPPKMRTDDIPFKSLRHQIQFKIG